ncbi:hypothetical protein GQ457_02G039490 [Hibiscus cannabinus]
MTVLKLSGKAATPSRYDITLDMLGLAAATGCEQSNPSFNTNSASCTTNFFSNLPSTAARMSPLSQQSVIQSARNNIGRLDVPVNDNLYPLLVQIEQRGRHVFDDLEPLCPVKVGIRQVVQKLVKASIRHVVINQKQFMLAPAVAEKPNQIRMPEATDGGDLGHKFSHPLH